MDYETDYETFNNNRICKFIREMIEDRELLEVDYPDHEFINDIKELSFTNFIFYAEPKDGNKFGRKTLIVFFPGLYLKAEVSKKLDDFFKNYDRKYDEIIFVVNNFTPQAIQYDYPDHIFLENFFYYNVSKHIFQPKIKQCEKSKTYKKCPILPASSPLCLWFGIKAGSMVEVSNVDDVSFKIVV